MLSVVCPIYNEERYIRSCIESILSQDYPKESLEVLFVDGMSTDRTREIVGEYARRYPFIRLIDNPRKIVPCAMNIGIRASRGEIVVRLDAHARYADNYLSVLSDALDELGADNVGAVCQTDILNVTPKTAAIREVLSNKFGVGNSVFRTGIDIEQEVDTVPFGCWRRSTFEKYGLFDERLIRNQDIELNKRILRNGGKIVIVPRTYSIYYARETYRELAKNNMGNGKWNILTIAFTHQLSSLGVRHFIPMLFVLSLILPVLLAVFWLPFIYISLLSLIFYFVVFATVSVRLAFKKHLSPFYLLWTFFVLHLSSGWGSLVGMWNLLCK